MFTWIVGAVSIVLMLWVLLRLNQAVQASLALDLGELTQYAVLFSYWLVLLS